MSTPAERLSSRSWRLRNTLWVLPVILCLGVVTWASFLYIGLRAKRTSWLVAAGLYGLGAIALLVLSALVPSPEEGQPRSGAGTAIGTFAMATWIVGIIHALTINRAWLRWKAHAGSQAWYAQSEGAPPSPRAQGAPTVDDMLLGRTAPPAAGPGPPPGWAWPPPAPPPPPHSAPVASAQRPPPVAPAAMVDLDLASAADLESHLGFDRRAAQDVVAARSLLGGFSSPDQLMTHGGIAPHIFAMIRDRVMVRPPPGTGHPPTPGRRLEL